MNKGCFIAEDLLPLYQEGLLQPETAEWLEEHMKTCNGCRELGQLLRKPVEKETIVSESGPDKMMAKINFKLSIYQIIFVGMSFFMAIRTSILNESFGFILWYAVLGAVTYLFYRNMKIVAVISFLPIFLWSLTQSAVDFSAGRIDSSLSAVSYFLSSAMGALWVAVIHLSFALIGSLIGALILKLKERG
ncbi:MAG TPA: zf-HC2 domain-containing protein [Bacillaceae bacterium]